MSKDNKDNLILDLTFQFSLKIIDFSETLEEMHKFVIANQVIRSGTSIGANAREAQNCESISDFIHKFKIAAKEVEETEYWLLLCNYSKKLPDAGDLLEELQDIKKIINKIITTSKTNS